MEELLALTFGTSVQQCTGSYAEAIGSLYGSATRTSRRFKECLRQETDTEFLIDFGPFLGRRLTEEVMAAIQGRIDPTRLIVSHQGAHSTDFEIGELNPSSMSWGRDILPAFEPTAKGVWSQNALKKNGGIVRGLLSGHTAYTVFENGFNQAIDNLQNASFQVQDGSRTTALPIWVESLNKFSNSVDLLADMRRRAADAYSRFSKGIHFEFMPAIGAELDPIEIKHSLVDSVYILATVGLIINCSGLAQYSVSPQEAARSFILLSPEFSI